MALPYIFVVHLAGERSLPLHHRGGSYIRLQLHIDVRLRGIEGTANRRRTVNRSLVRGI